jgi:serine/threonine protein kinase
VLNNHTLSEDEAKYIILGLINIIEKSHQQKFALTELSPLNIIIDKKTGDMKLCELLNPLPIDSYYPSSMIMPLNCYSAPEILLMDRILAESDYYSLGLIMYYIMKNKVIYFLFQPAFHADIAKNRMAVINASI